MSLMLEALKQLESRGALKQEPLGRKTRGRRAASGQRHGWPRISDAVTAMSASGWAPPEPESQYSDPFGRPGAPQTLPLDLSGWVETEDGGQPGVPIDLPAAGPMSEYRDVRDRIVQQCAGLRSPVLLFTAPQPIETSRFSLPALAAAFAERPGQNVLVVNADWRHARDPAIRHSELPFGLSDVMRGLTDWTHVVRPTNVPRLWCVSNGTHSDVRLGDDFGWEELRHRFGFTLVEAGPVNEAGTVELARSCDATYLVVSLHETRRAGAERALAALQASGTHVIGCVAANASVWD